MAGSIGGKWSFSLYFHPEADNTSESAYIMQHSDLINTLQTLIGTDEEILNISAYKHKLDSLQLTSFLLYHLFIVFETKSWWWSIEKDTKGIVFQRSRHPAAVKYNSRQTQRESTISLVKSDTGRKSVKDLIAWLYTENELGKVYNFTSNDCKDFAKRVFDFAARRHTLTWVDGALS